MRAKYNAGELDPNTQIIDGIRSALESSQAGRALTTIKAVETIDIDGDLSRKIRYICLEIGCTHEVTGEEVIFRKCEHPVKVTEEDRREARLKNIYVVKNCPKCGKLLHFDSIRGPEDLEERPPTLPRPLPD